MFKTPGNVNTRHFFTNEKTPNSEVKTFVGNSNTKRSIVEKYPFKNLNHKSS